MNEQLPQPPDTSEQELRERAEKRVEDRSHLLQHIGSYIIINGFLVVVMVEKEIERMKKRSQ